MKIRSFVCRLFITKTKRNEMKSRRLKRLCRASCDMSTFRIMTQLNAVSLLLFASVYNMHDVFDDIASRRRTNDFGCFRCRFSSVSFSLSLFSFSLFSLHMFHSEYFEMSSQHSIHRKSLLMCRKYTTVENKIGTEICWFFLVFLLKHFLCCFGNKMTEADYYLDFVCLLLECTWHCSISSDSCNVNHIM